jgi:hypothetical protein
LSDVQQEGPPMKEERLGFFGYALGLVIFFSVMIALNFAPGISDIMRPLMYVEPGYTIPYFISQIYPLILAIPFFFIPRKRTVV